MWPQYVALRHSASKYKRALILSHCTILNFEHESEDACAERHQRMENIIRSIGRIWRLQNLHVYWNSCSCELSKFYNFTEKVRGVIVRTAPQILTSRLSAVEIEVIDVRNSSGLAQEILSPLQTLWIGTILGCKTLALPSSAIISRCMGRTHMPSKTGYPKKSLRFPKEFT